LAAVGDILGNGSADPIIQNPNNNGWIYHGNMTGGAFQGWVAVTATPGYTVVGAGDLIHNGNAGIIVEQQGSGEIYYANMAGGSFQGWGAVADTPGWNVVRVGDLTHDRYADAVIVQNPSTGETLYANMAGGSLQGWGRVASPAQISGLCQTTCVVRGIATVDGTGYQAVLF
jgi:hypothetical protein